MIFIIPLWQYQFVTILYVYFMDCFKAININLLFISFYRTLISCKKYECSFIAQPGDTVQATYAFENNIKVGLFGMAYQQFVFKRASNQTQSASLATNQRKFV